MTTVSKLLSDDMFNEIHDVSNDQYNECMQYYIRGQYKQCLESLFKHDLIETERGKQLFINCCYKLRSFDILGRSFNSILDDFFGIHKWEKYIIQLNLNEIKDIAVISRILQCCYKWLQWTQCDKDSTILETYIQFVETVLSRFLKDNNRQVDAIYELIMFYINDVKINLLNESRSTSLYTNMCRKYPLISDILSEKSVLGPSYEECIKSNLKPKRLLPRTKEADTSNDINTKIHCKIKKEENIDIRKPKPIIDHITEEEHNKNNGASERTISYSTSTTDTSAFDLKDMIYQYKKLTHHYLHVLKSSPYKKYGTVGLMFILLVIYKNRRHIRRVSNTIGKWISTLFSVLDQY